MINELEALASELPMFTEKGNYKYIEEISGNGSYYQVAWQKLSSKYVPLYDTKPVVLKNSETTNDIFEDEEDY